MAAAAELWEPRAARGKRTADRDPSTGAQPADAGGARSAAIPGCTAPRPLPARRPASPPRGPPPCRLREAGTRRRRLLLQSRLSHSLGNPAVAAPSEPEHQSREPADQPAKATQTDGGANGRTDRRGFSQTVGVLKFRHELGHGAVGESERGALARPAVGPRGARARRAPRTVGCEARWRSPPLAEAGRPPLCVQTPSRSAGGCGAAVRAYASAPARGLRTALGQRGGAAGGCRARRHPPSLTFRTPGSVPGRTSQPLYISAWRRGRGSHCPEGAPFQGQKGAARGPRPTGAPGARASPIRGGAGSREAPPTALAPGRGSRVALFGARPPASHAQPTRPLPLHRGSRPGWLRDSDWATHRCYFGPWGCLLGSELN